MNSQPTIYQPRDAPAPAPDAAFNPLWMIAIAMAAFFTCAALVIALG
jgi:hypothetical protein